MSIEEKRNRVKSLAGQFKELETLEYVKILPSFEKFFAWYEDTYAYIIDKVPHVPEIYPSPDQLREAWEEIKAVSAVINNVNNFDAARMSSILGEALEKKYKLYYFSNAAFTGESASKLGVTQTFLRALGLLNHEQQLRKNPESPLKDDATLKKINDKSDLRMLEVDYLNKDAQRIVLLLTLAYKDLAESEKAQKLNREIQ